MQQELEYIKSAILIDGIKRTNYEVSYKHCRVIDELSKYNTYKKTLFKKEYTPVKGDRVFIYPGCTIPRFKIKQFCENYNVAVIKAGDKANVKIANEKSLLTYISYKSGYSISKEEFINGMHLVNKKYPDIERNKALINDLNNSTSNKVYIQYGFQNEFANVYGLNFKKISYDSCHYFNTDDDYSSFYTLMTADNIYGENEVLKRLNSGAVMDEKQYLGAKQLLNSKDVENTKLAIEMMANCDFEKSSVYLLLLIQEFGNKIFDCQNRNHVNFKSLLKFFNITNLRGVDLDDIISTLIDLNLLNQANLNVLEPLLVEDMNTYVNNYLTVDKIGYTDKVSEALDKNILDSNKNTEVVFEEPEIINPHL